LLFCSEPPVFIFDFLAYKMVLYAINRI